MDIKNKNRFTLKLGAIALAGCVGVSGMAFAQEPADDPEANLAEADAVVEEKEEIRTIGKEGADTVRVLLTNKTGKDIYYISIDEVEPEEDESEEVEEDETFEAEDDSELIAYLQEALIYKGYLDAEANGIYDEVTETAVEAYRAEQGLPAGAGMDDDFMEVLLDDYYEGNLVDYKDCVKADETVNLIYPAAKKDVDESAENEADAAEVKYEVYIGFMEYDEEFDEYYLDLYILHQFPAEEGCEISVFYSDDEFVYIEYIDVKTGELVSTYESEKKISEEEYQEIFASWDDSEEYEYEDEDEEGEVLYIEDLLDDLSDDGETWYEDEDGNAYVEDAEGNLYAVDEEGNRTLLEEYVEGEDLEIDVDGTWYEDEDGNYYLEDLDGNFYMVDDNGNFSLMDDEMVSQFIWLDEGEDISDYLTDEDGDWVDDLEDGEWLGEDDDDWLDLDDDLDDGEYLIDLEGEEGEWTLE